MECNHGDESIHPFRSLHTIQLSRRVCHFGQHWAKTMPGSSYATREAGLPPSEPAKVVPFHDLLPEEPFHCCVHITQRSKFKRCGKTLQPLDRAVARTLFEKIQSSLVDDLPVQDLLLRFANFTLCNGWHRPAKGVEGLYIRMVTRWSKDLEKGVAAHQQAIAEDTATRATRNEVDLLVGSPVVSTDRDEFSEDNTTSPDPDSAKSHPVDEKEPSMESIKFGPDSSLKKGSTLVREAEIGPIDNETRLKRVTRSGTITQTEVDYLPYSPKLLALSPSQLVHETNKDLLGRISKPLVKTAHLDGYVYMFTRAGDPKLVKIGYTKNDPERRIAAWGRKCCYNAREEFVTKLTPHAWLVERLALLELKHCRKVEQNCKWNPNCDIKHGEWCSVSVNEARRVIERWAAWMTTYRPWGPDYILRPEWRDLLDKCRIAVNQPSSDKDMWERFVRREHPRNTVPILQSPYPEDFVEQERPIGDNTPTTTPSRKPTISPTTPHGTYSKTPEMRWPSKLHTTFPNSPTISSCSNTPPPLTPSSSSSPPSSSPSTPTLPSRRTTWGTSAPPPELFRDTLKSAFAYMDDHIGTGSSSGKTRTTSTRLSIRLSQKSISMSLKWGEVGEGLCCAVAA